jgi:hypothetical protein
VTIGTLKFRLSKAFPSVDPDLIEGWIGDCYDDILAVLPWSRTEVQSVLITTAPYDTGTVTVTNGSAAVTLDAGAWTAEMTGRAFRIPARNEFYEFTYATATTGTLDRPYEGLSDTEVGYSIYQTVYPLPADARMLADDAFGTFGIWGQVERTTRARMRALGYAYDSSSYPWGPLRWATYMDDASTPPRLQVELYPIPAEAVGIPFTYLAETPSASNTSTILETWIRPTALIEGTTARIKRQLLDYTGGREHDALYQRAVSSMIGEEARRTGPTEMRLDPYYTAHRRNRAR